VDALLFLPATVLGVIFHKSVLPGGDHSFTRFPEYVAQLIEFCGL
jgi:predicted esterase YcpF (UPF0227 family)